METEREEKNAAITVIRWSARVLWVILMGVFLPFLGEGTPGNSMGPLAAISFGLLGIYAVAMCLALKWERAAVPVGVAALLAAHVSFRQRAHILRGLRQHSVWPRRWPAASSEGKGPRWRGNVRLFFLYLGSGAIAMRQIAISVWLGFLALPALFFGAARFDVNGQPTPLKGIVRGCAAVALCLAVCQFLVARRSGREADAGAAATGMFTAGQRPREIGVRLPGWSLPLAMLAPVVGMCCLMLLLDPKPSERIAPAFLSAGIIGLLAGAALAKATVKRRTRG